MYTQRKESIVLVLGIILIVLGLLVPTLAILFKIGLVLAVIGAVLLVAPSLGLNGGRPLGGRRYY